jgi:hypothetical protein
MPDGTIDGASDGSGADDGAFDGDGELKAYQKLRVSTAMSLEHR